MYRFIIILTSSLALLFTMPAWTHPGGTDSSGCHAGSRAYHCHGGGGGGFSSRKKSKPKDYVGHWSDDGVYQDNLPMTKAEIRQEKERKKKEKRREKLRQKEEMLRQKEEERQTKKQAQTIRRIFHKEMGLLKSERKAIKRDMRKHLKNKAKPSKKNP